MAGDVPVPGDYDGNGKVSIAVWRSSTGTWYVKGPGTTDWGASSGNRYVKFGEEGDIPVPMDYFNEGKLRLAVFRPSNGVWYIKDADFNSERIEYTIQCGMNKDVPVPGDYFGDGVVRLAVWRPSNGNWYIKGVGTKSWAGSRASNLAIQAGTKGDIPVPYDFYGEGKLRMAVYRPSKGFLYIKGDGFKNWSSSREGNKQCRVKPFSGYKPVNLYSDSSSTQAFAFQVEAFKVGAFKIK